MASILLPAAFGAIFYRHIPKPLRTLAILFFFSVATEVNGYACFLLKMNNMPIFHLYTFFHYAIIILIYLQLFQTILIKRILLLSLVAFSCFVIIDMTLITSIFEPNSLSRTVESILIILTTVAFMLEQRRSNHFVTRQKRAYTLLTIGLLLFFTGTILVSVYSDQLMDSQLYSIWVIHSVLNIALNILYTVVIWNSIGLRRSSID